LAVQPGKASERTFIETARRSQIVAAAIDTIAEVGYANASLGRIAEKVGISRGLISYHFAGKDELMREVVREVIEQARAFMTRRILAHSTGPEMLRAYIESNLEFIRDHQSETTAIVEIVRNAIAADRQNRSPRFDNDEAVRALAHLLSRFQEAGQFRADLDPRAIAIAVRGAIDSASARLRFDPEFDVDAYTRQMTDLFELGTRTPPQ
jgi:AcrR family transcriptional regulator